MSTRVLVIAVIVVTLATAVAAGVIALAMRGGNERTLSVQQVQAAFTHSGIPLPCVTEKGQKTAPCGFYVDAKKGPGAIPDRSHLIAFMSGKSLDRSKFRVVEVWDSADSLQPILQIGSDRDRLVVANIMYSGLKTKAARRAMAGLSRELKK